MTISLGFKRSQIDAFEWRKPLKFLRKEILISSESVSGLYDQLCFVRMEFKDSFDNYSSLKENENYRKVVRTCHNNKMSKPSDVDYVYFPKNTNTIL